MLLCAALLGGCTRISNDFPDDEPSATSSDIYYETTPPEEPPSEEITSQEETAPVPRLPVPDYDISPKSFSLSLEAETGGLSGGVFVASKSGKFSGKGYATGFFQSTDAAAHFSVKLPAAQHYNLGLYVRADENAHAYVTAGDEKYELAPAQTDEFYIYYINALYLDAGEQEIVVSGGFNGFELDKLTIESCDEVYSSKFKPDSSPVNKKVSAEAKKLYSFLLDSFGKKCITGQYASSPKNTEAKLIYNITGSYPLMRLADIASEEDEITACAQWAEKGGIVSLMWYWNSPLGEPAVYQKETDFDISSAVTDKDVALLPESEVEQLYIKGDISRECLFLLRDIDRISEKLQVLRDKKIPVLWRPLHEPDSMLYWWSKDAEAYKWLWQLMYKRQTEYFGLDNLLWVWNGTDSAYYVGNSLCDIASADSYIVSPKKKTCSDSFRSLYKFTEGKKICALAECGSLPEMNLLSRDRCIWSFFGLWYGDYIVNSSGSLNESNITSEQLIAAYRSELALNLGDYSQG